MLKRFFTAYVSVLLLIFVFLYGCGQVELTQVFFDEIESIEVTDVPESIQTLLFSRLGTREELVNRFLLFDGDHPDYESLVDFYTRAIDEIDLKRTYYNRYVDAGGIAIIGNSVVEDHYFIDAREVVLRMTFKRPDIREQLSAEHGFYIVLLNIDSSTSELPENAFRENFPDFPGECGGLLCYSKVSKERFEYMSVFVHEFAHAIHSRAINGRRIKGQNVPLDETFESRLKVAYAEAINTGRWQGHYASTNYREYWAEGVRIWYYEVAENSRFPTYYDFEAYDPLLYELIAAFFNKDSFLTNLPFLEKS